MQLVFAFAIEKAAVQMNGWTKTSHKHACDGAVIVRQVQVDIFLQQK